MTGTAIFNDMQAMSQMKRPSTSLEKRWHTLKRKRRVRVWLNRPKPQLRRRQTEIQEPGFEKPRRQIIDVKKYAKELGLQQNPKLLEKIKYLLDYGYGNQFEVRFSTRNRR